MIAWRENESVVRTEDAPDVGGRRGDDEVLRPELEPHHDLQLS